MRKLLDTLRLNVMWVEVGWLFDWANQEVEKIAKVNTVHLAPPCDLPYGDTTTQRRLSCLNPL